MTKLDALITSDEELRISQSYLLHTLWWTKTQSKRITHICISPASYPNHALRKMQILSLMRCVIVLASAFSARLCVLIENSASPAHSPLLSRSIHPPIHPSIWTLIPPRGQYDYLSWERHLFACASACISQCERSILASPLGAARILFTCRARAQHEQYQNTGLIKAHYASACNAKNSASSHCVRSALMQRFWLYHPIAISSASPAKRDVYTCSKSLYWN